VLSAAYPAGAFLGAIPSGLVAGRLGVKPTTIVGLTLVASLALALRDAVPYLALSAICTLTLFVLWRSHASIGLTTPSAPESSSSSSRITGDA
jgi:MFS family permease